MSMMSHWRTLILEAFMRRLIPLIRSLFESALKTNDSLEFAVITGCLRISKESIFTGLNNLKIISITNPMYSEHFGFTQKEVDEILAFYDRSDFADVVKRWYDGFIFGEYKDIYNPWSIIKFLDTPDQQMVPERMAYDRDDRNTAGADHYLDIWFKVYLFRTLPRTPASGHLR